MTTLTDDIFSQLSRADVQQIGSQLGTGQAQTAGAIAAALPMILGAMGRNTAEPQGAEALLGALGRDHTASGGIGEILGAVLGGQQSRQTDGLGQLGHIFGGRMMPSSDGMKLPASARAYGSISRARRSNRWPRSGSNGPSACK